MRFFTILTIIALSLTSHGAIASDATAGKKVFKKCSACHSVKAGKNKIGPSLFSIVGAGISEDAKFKYSKAFIAKKGHATWDAATLDTFLASPKKWEPKTKMTFPGLKKQEDRDNVIAYLATIK